MATLTSFSEYHGPYGSDELRFTAESAIQAITAIAGNVEFLANNFLSTLDKLDETITNIGQEVEIANQQYAVYDKKFQMKFVKNSFGSNTVQAYKQDETTNKKIALNPEYNCGKFEVERSSIDYRYCVYSAPNLNNPFKIIIGIFLAYWTKLEIVLEEIHQNLVATNHLIQLKKMQKWCQITLTRKILSMLQWIKDLPV